MNARVETTVTLLPHALIQPEASSVGAMTFILATGYPAQVRCDKKTAISYILEYQGSCTPKYILNTLKWPIVATFHSMFHAIMHKQINIYTVDLR